jgi:hypothetical protein
VTSSEEPLDAWELFYRNSLRRLAAAATGAGEPRPGTLADFAPVYTRAEHLVGEVAAADVVDLASCFGFFPLRLAEGCAGRLARVWATDISASACGLLAVMSTRLAVRRRLSTLVCDASCVPLPAGSADVVTALHLLEHVDAEHGRRILDEAVRLARRRVVVAVPLELEPDPTFGHVRTLDLAGLAEQGERLAPRGWHARVESYHGGWLVLDRIEQ